jgi:hypothetical protein
MKVQHPFRKGQNTTYVAQEGAPLLEDGQMVK